MPTNPVKNSLNDAASENVYRQQVVHDQLALSKLNVPAHPLIR
jgi:hypothetical protein